MRSVQAGEVKSMRSARMTILLAFVMPALSTQMQDLASELQAANLKSHMQRISALQAGNVTSLAANLARHMQDLALELQAGSSFPQDVVDESEAVKWTEDKDSVLMPKFVNQLIDRTMKVSTVHHVELDNTTLEKVGHLPAMHSGMPLLPFRTLPVSTQSVSALPWAGMQAQLHVPPVRQAGGMQKKLAGTPVFAPGRHVQCSSLAEFLLPAPVIIGAAAVAWCSQAIKIVQEGDVAIVERFGQFSNRLTPGLHIIIPLVDRIRRTLTTREQVLDVPPQKCITSDNAPLTADAVVYWRVFDPELALYAIVNLEQAIENLVLTQLRAEIGKLTLDQTFSAREKINAALLQDLDVATDPWGVKITRVEVRDIIPNRELLQAMEMQMAAERTKRAAIIKSEGERERSINEAEGIAQSRVIDAKASAEAVKLQADAEACKLELEAAGASKALEAIEHAVGGKDEAARFQLMCAYIAAQRALSTSDNSKVIVTSSAADDVFAKAIAFYDASRNAKMPQAEHTQLTK